MHQAASPRKAVAAPSAAAGAAAQAGPLAFVALVVANVALAFGPWFVRVAGTEGVGPIAAGLWRITLAAPVIAALAWGSGARPRRLDAGLWMALVIGGVAFAADLAAWHLGIGRTRLANATLFGNSATLIYPLYGFLVARAWPTRAQGVALALAAAGAVLLMGRSYQLDARNLVGDLLCLLAGVLYTGYFIAMARARETMTPLAALALSTLASILPLLAFTLVAGERVWPAHWGALVGLALVSQVIGQGCMIYALGALSPLVVGLALLLQPVVAGAVGWIAYGEKLALPDLAGAVLVAVALVLVRRGGPVAPGAARPHRATEETA